jgi:carotenoid cleavage dioxygenase
MTAAAQRNPFLANNFGPIDSEVTVTQLDIIGAIPQELSGLLARNGPNPQFEPPGQYHWFDGDGMIHGVYLQDGRATYRNRYVRTAKFLKEQEAKRALWTGLLEPPRPEQPEGSSNCANTALVHHGHKFLALWEGGEPYALDVQTLATIGPYTFDGALPSAFTAHPKVDPETGEMMFFGYGLKLFVFSLREI